MTPSEAEVRALVRRAVDALLPEIDGPRGAAGPSDDVTPDDVTAGRSDDVTPDDVTAGSPDDVTVRRSDDVAADIAIGADHGGVALKADLVGHLSARGYAVRDCGTHGAEAVDYPDVARAVARLVAGGACRWGIVVDGAGIGSCMAANKVPGVRAALCYDISTARNSREHSHANVLALGAGQTGAALARQIVDAWLATEWGGGRHARRVAKIEPNVDG